MELNSNSKRNWEIAMKLKNKQRKFIGKKLTEARQLRGLTLLDLAKEVNISSSRLSRFELGEDSPSIEEIWQLGGALHVSSDFFYIPDKYEVKTLCTYWRS